jgi:hypothetical protein
LGLVGGLEAKSRARFVKRVALAIEDIKARAAGTTESMVPKTKVVQEKEEVTERVDEKSNANRNRTQAKRYLDEDPEVAIVFLRRGAEALAKDLYRRLGNERNGKPARKMMLEELLKPLRDSDAPELFKLLVQTFQLFGNFAAHDQDDQSTYVTKEVASALLSLFDEAIVIYEAWLAKKPS